MLFAWRTSRSPQTILANVSTGPNCWEWLGSLTGGGYGGFSAVTLAIKTNERAHRASFFLHYGYMPRPPLVVMHKCDNRKCVRPDHLTVGTTRENVADMDRKGRRRQARGSQVGNSKLQEADVVAIRRRLAAGERRAPIAADYKISARLIGMIEHKHVWGWL